MTTTFDPVREAEELREQLGSDRRRLLVFFGAGTSQAVGIDGVVQLTKNVASDLTGDQRAHYDRLLSQSGTGAHVEHVLNRVRLCREMIGDSKTVEADGIKGEDATKLDRAICSAIYNRVKVDPPKGFQLHAEFAAWLSSIQRTKPVEIFTTNYDLLIERGLEIAMVPYFDGFVGTVNPYFSDAAADFKDDNDNQVHIPRSWARLWKIHGSIGWRAATEVVTGTKKILRLPLVPPTTNDDLMIFPSREKYLDSRRLPFVALQDRLRRLTASGECLLLIAGYSFGDQHINDIIFGNLRSNNRFSATVLSFDSLKTLGIGENLIKPAQGIRNLTVYGPDMALVGGVLGKWSAPAKPPASMTKWPFWDDASGTFSLGNFANFPNFLREFIGARQLTFISPAPPVSSAAPVTPTAPTPVGAVVTP
ncbi:SIR2 family protein [Bradyrhizobium sp. AUGA SZCCT0182]|uniref:SIR2 family protein n=1 Tax=Bradyrhizobium sp. AUGA SZCCT0182 TaxID=2807667 RepID=UPI001BADCC0E|nr:SIR2 family protein [Bradyrhizobium sp. AUGA SZCCT0182]MBR1231694.1 SIR2 family protein [Bradyrhizobium sp. AUGA SZCCT0182]